MLLFYVVLIPLGKIEASQFCCLITYSKWKNNALALKKRTGFSYLFDRQDFRDVFPDESMSQPSNGRAQAKGGNGQGIALARLLLRMGK